MTRSLTPMIETINNSTSTAVLYDATVTSSETPAHTSIKANTNLTVVYQP